ncbi:MAG: hypothetical protein C4303_06865 [candidate division GAL15 bacterium]
MWFQGSPRRAEAAPSGKIKKMPFTTADFLDLLRLLEQHPEWKTALRAAILGEELLQLPELVRRLAEAQERSQQQLYLLTQQVQALAEAHRRTEEAQHHATEQIRALTEAQQRTEQRVSRLEDTVAELIHAQHHATEQIRALTEAQQRMETAHREIERQLARLSEEVRELVRNLGRMEERWGLAHEEIAEDLLPQMLQKKGWQVLRVARLDFDGEVDLLVAVQVQGRLFTLAVEVKGRVWSRTPADEILRKLTLPAFLDALRRQGFPEPVVPAVFGFLVYEGAADTARQSGVGLFTPRGELVAPSLP